MFLIDFLVASSTLYGLAALYAFSSQFRSVRQEINEGMYSAAPYLIATTMIQLPMMFALSLADLVPAFFLANWELSALGNAAWIFSLYLWSFDSIAQLLSLMPNVLMGVLTYMTVWFCGFLFSGVFAATPDVVWPLRAVCYVLPIGWTLPTLTYEIFTKSPDYEGAESCDSWTRFPALDPSYATARHMCAQRGFYCADDLAGQACYGISGCQILDSLGLSYDALGCEDQTTRNAIVVFCIGITFKLAYCVIFVLLCRNKTEAAAPLPREAAITLRVAEGKPHVKSEAQRAVAAREQVKLEASGREQHEGFHSFTFSDCAYAIKVPPPGMGRCFARKVERRLISHVTASAASGRVLAILGPSGAGKTTLLNMLALESSAGEPSGALLLDGQSFSLKLYRQRCGYVTQQDVLWAFLSCREHIRTAIELYQPQMGAAEKAAMETQLLESMGLESCAEIKAGNALFKGLSGGQRRRLSVAVSLAKRPKLLMLDEPTSGLDSASASAVTAYLKTAALKLDAAIICTVHQPSRRVFESFDDVLILSSGRTAYFGPRSRLCEHLESLGKPCPANANPAEWALDVVNKDFVDASEVDGVLDAWALREPPRPPQMVAPAEEVPPVSAGVITQSLALIRKNLKLTIREPLLYTGRMVMIVFLTIFFCVVFVEARSRTQQSIMQYIYLIFFITVVPTLLSVSVVYAHSVELAAVKREIKDGMYPIGVYVLAQVGVAGSNLGWGGEGSEGRRSLSAEERALSIGSPPSHPTIASHHRIPPSHPTIASRTDRYPTY